MFYAFCHNWSIVLCETKSKLFPARIPNYQAVFRKVWILYKFGFVGKSKLLDFPTMPTATESLSFILYSLKSNRKYSAKMLKWAGINTSVNKNYILRVGNCQCLNLK